MSDAVTLHKLVLIEGLTTFFLFGVTVGLALGYAILKKANRLKSAVETAGSTPAGTATPFAEAIVFRN
jgi:hypothetical protein